LEGAVLNMQQDSNNGYQWRIYERILLGFASAYGWLPIAWIFLMIIFMFMSAVFPREFPLIAVLFCIYVGLFGVLACFFPGKYILPAWILNLILLFLNVKQIATSLIDPYDFNSDPDLGSGFVDYHTFSLNKVFLAIFALISLTILFRPAVFYVRVLWNKIRK